MTPAPTKHCSRCGLEKPIADFAKDRGKQDGVQSWCRVCHAAASLTYYHRKKNAPDPLPPPSKWVALTCACCGGEMRYRRSEIESRQRRGVPLPRFCSVQCSNRCKQQSRAV